MQPVVPVGQSKIWTQYVPGDAPFGAKSSWPSVATGVCTWSEQVDPDSAPKPIPMVIPFTGVEPATVVRLLMMTLRSVDDCEYTTANVLMSAPSGWSVPVNASVWRTGVGAAGLLLQLVTRASRIAPGAINQPPLKPRRSPTGVVGAKADESRAEARLCIENGPFKCGALARQATQSSASMAATIILSALSVARVFRGRYRFAACAQALFLLPQLGRELRAEVVCLEHLPNLDLDIPVRVERTSRSSARHPHWWIDDPDPAAAGGIHPGAKHVNRWREEFLRDFAARMLRCSTPASSQSNPKLGYLLWP